MIEETPLSLFDSLSDGPSRDHTEPNDGAIPPTGVKKPDVSAPEDVQNLIKTWADRIKAAKTHFAKDFERMAYCEQIVAEGAEEGWVNEKLYVVPIVNRHINQAVAALYAKNPTAVAKRRKKLLYTVWDGKPESIQMAMQGAAVGDPMALALMDDIAQAQQYDQMVDKMAKTMEILFAYYLGEQSCAYKESFKQLVRRTKTVGVGYVKLNFQRILEKRPEITAQIDDATQKVAAIEAQLQMAANGDLAPDAPELAELNQSLADLQSQETIVVREGPVLDFPRAKEVIIDPKCRLLKTLEGARWIAHEFDMTPEDILETYKIDVRSCHTQYGSSGTPISASETTDEQKQSKAKVWQVWDKKTLMVFTICDGYPAYLKQPAAPDVKVERFFTVFPLVFNEIEHEKKLYPPSDAWLIRHGQQEYNTSRQGLREHRRANRPAYLVAKGKLQDDDLDKLESRPSHAVLTIRGLTPGEDVQKVVQRFPFINIDPNVYEVETVFNDMLRTVGTSEAQFGNPGGGTATEASIAEQGRMSTLGDNIDDLDDMLTALSRAMGQLMLLELSIEVVREIAGPGAVWPEQPMTREEVSKDLTLDIRAGSSGKPNQAAELSKLERAAPMLQLLPGINPRPLVQRYADLLDIDIDELYVEGLPSITALNAAMGRPPAPVAEEPGNDPNAQGTEGVSNAPGPEEPPGSQAPFPAPGQEAGIAPMQTFS